MHRFYWVLTGLTLALLAACFIGGYSLLATGGRGQLKPIHPTPAPLGAISGEVTVVHFAELNQTPDKYRDKFIRVSGSFSRLPKPTCRHSRGPAAGWALIDENLRLDAAGFDRYIRLVPDETSITVEGIWRMYEGPLGCGKRPAAGVAWYLETQRIVEPNPLPQLVGAPLPLPAGPPWNVLVEPSVTLSPALATPTEEFEEVTSPTPGEVVTLPAVATLTPTPTFTGTADATVAVTPTLTGTPPATVTGTPPGPGTPALTPTATITPTPESTLPGLPTATPGTPGGYPGPEPTTSPPGYP